MICNGKLAANITPTFQGFMFRGTCSSFNEIKDIKYNYGDIVMDSSTDNIYMYTGDNWLLLGDYEEKTQTTKEVITEVADVKCKNCGAPLIKYNKHSKTVKCDYCDSVFDIREISTVW